VKIKFIYFKILKNTYIKKYIEVFDKFNNLYIIKVFDLKIGLPNKMITHELYY